MKHTLLRTVIANNWPHIVEQARKRGFRHEATLPSNPRILGTSTKVRLGEHLSVLTEFQAHIRPNENNRVTWMDDAADRDATASALVRAILGAP